MKTLYYIFSISLFTLTPLITLSKKPEYRSHFINPTTVEIDLHYILEPKEYLYKDSISIFVDHPSYKLSPFKSSKEIVTRYDPTFKKSKKIFEDTVTFSVQITIPEDDHTAAYLHVATATNKNGTDEIVVPIPTFKNENKIHESVKQEEQKNKLLIKNSSTMQSRSFSLSEYISNLIKTINSPFMRIILVYFLGMLLSLTPCIYPMVPITIGILQAQGSKSLLYNFLSAAAYTCGIATTFALFGLLASCTGPLCGQLLMEPIFIIGLIILLTYLGLSMLGFYDVYVPKFFKPSTQNFKGGSLLSTFIFGAASGTIASPCVSPGLVLLLSIVATLNNIFLGFFLLFVFGIGLSTPLLIVGTFSSSLNLLPRAGLWMVEIKKLFGFMIFGMCFYYINYIIPTSILLWILGAFIAGVGLYYSYTSQKMAESLWKKINFWLGIVALIASALIFFQAYRYNTYAKEDSYNEHKNLWHSSYEHALEQARLENKKLFIDFWATFCPVCLAINKTVLTKFALIQALKENYILLKVDGSHNANIPYATLKNKFPIKGFPTFLIVDPTTETIISEFGGELYDMAEEEFIEKLRNK